MLCDMGRGLLTRGQIVARQSGSEKKLTACGVSCKRCVQVVQLRNKRWTDFDQAGGRFQTELCNAKAWSPTLHFEVWRRRGLSRSVKFARVLGCSEEQKQSASCRAGGESCWRLASAAPSDKVMSGVSCLAV